MRTLTSLAVLAVLLAGCSGGGSPGPDDHFPDRDELPSGWVYALGPEQGDAERLGKSRGGTEADEIWYAGLQGAGSTHAGSIVVLAFDDEARAAAVAKPSTCDGTNVYHLLRNGDIVVFLGIHKDRPQAARTAMDQVATTIVAETGATRIC